MKKYTITVSNLRYMINRAHVSERSFCRQTGLNRGDFYRFIRGQKELSELNIHRIVVWAKENNLIDLVDIKHESLISKVCGWFKG